MDNALRSNGITRRSLISTAGALGLAAITDSRPVFADEKPAVTAAEPFRYCLNTSTVRGSNLPLSEVIGIAGKAGFHGIEPWIAEIDKSVAQGISLAELRKRIDDAGLKVEDAIAFGEWVVDEDDRRAKGFEKMKQDMDMVAQLGGKHIAAPAKGASDPKDPRPSPSLQHMAERYHALGDLGRQMGVTPLIEVWGHSKTLTTLSDAAYVATASGDPNACILLDVFHLYKGGSPIEGLKLMNGRRLPVIHTNDYPADPPREKINDSYRVYPGDGVAPLGEIFRTLRDIGFTGALSVELFNKDYWKQSPVKVAQTVIEKTRAAVKAALA